MIKHLQPSPKYDHNFREICCYDIVSLKVGGYLEEMNMVVALENCQHLKITIKCMTYYCKIDDSPSERQWRKLGFHTTEKHNILTQEICMKKINSTVGASNVDAYSKTIESCALQVIFNKF